MANEISFGTFCLELNPPRLWRSGERIPLQPRPLAVLSYLAVRAGAVVSRDELLSTLWAGTHVTKAVLKVAVRAARAALEDESSAARYIETVGREGYRFVGSDLRRWTSATLRASDGTIVVGREAELAALQRHFGAARDGHRTVVFVSGEAGIGKTTLVERFLADASLETRTWIARGQCLDHYGEGEPYLPVLEAMGRLTRERTASPMTEAVRRLAPTWASRLPGIEPSDASASRARARTPARMLREMADAIEVGTRAHTLVVVVEDLQWSDPSTVDLLAHVARRREPARLLVVGTFRPSDLIVHDHPLRGLTRELQASGRCHEMGIGLLSVADVDAYVGARFASLPAADRRHVAAWILERSEGNALFMVNVADDLVAHEVLIEHDGQWSLGRGLVEAAERIPVGLREFIERRFHTMPPAVRRVLEAASVVGDEFVVESVAVALQDGPTVVEGVCEGLSAQSTVIADAGVVSSPDGVISGRYRFLHGLYRRVLYDGIAPARRVRLHRAVGLREEANLGAARGAHAAVLAMHFARGRDPRRALGYHELAASAALERYAPHEAVTHYTAALAALADASDVEDRPSHELRLVAARATLLMATQGYAADETERAFAHARALCDAEPTSPARPVVLRGLVSYHHVRAQLGEAHALGEQLLAEAVERPDDPILAVQAHYGHGATLFHEGDLPGARFHLEQALSRYDERAHDEHTRCYGGYDPGVACSYWLAWTLALMGHLPEALALDRRGAERAHRQPDPFSLAWAHYAAGVSQQVFGDWRASEACSGEAMRLAEDHGFPHVLGMATVNRGWAMVMLGNTAQGIPMLRQGVMEVEATGAALVRSSYWAMLAAAEAIERRFEAALGWFDDALAEIERTGERLHEPAVLIGKSHVLSLLGGREGDAEDCLRRAARIANEQRALLVGLRATIALARQMRGSGRRDEARAALTEAHAGFVDAPALAPEVIAARGLLASL